MSLLSDLSDLFSIRRRGAYASNSSVKASADGPDRSQRRSLSAKYQTFFSTISHDLRSVNEPDLGSKKIQETIDPTIPPILNTVTPTARNSASPVVVIFERSATDISGEDPETPEKPRLRRRPKTPIRRVGEIEGYTEQTIQECSSALAQEYQAVLEPRTPVQSPTVAKSLRKIGGYKDLRRTSLDSESEASMSPNLSDVETVVGSERSPDTSMRRLRLNSNNSFCSSGSSWSARSVSSYYSAASEKNFSAPEKKRYAVPEKIPHPNQEVSAKHVEATNNIEMKICLDLLKQDLSSALSPSNHSDSTFVWLMIESYESMKQRLHQQIQSQTTPGKETSEVTFQVLDHWLEALYSVYNTLLQDVHPTPVQRQVATKIEAVHRENVALQGALCA